MAPVATNSCGIFLALRYFWIALFEGVPSPFEAMRYHSLVVAPDRLPGDLEVTAWSSDRPPGAEIMALCHRSLPVYGVQFHPESVATREGKRLLENFLALAA